MPTTHFTVHTSLAPLDVLRLFTDFGPDRASRWPNIDEGHFTVHDVGEDWAEVTEGNSLGWERERYAWDADAGTRWHGRAGHPEPGREVGQGQAGRGPDPDRGSPDAGQAVPVRAAPGRVPLSSAPAAGSNG